MASDQAKPRMEDIPKPQHDKRKIVRFSDFDGAIFINDTGHILFDSHGCGSKKRELLDEQIKSGERSFRDVSEEMWGSLNVPFDDGFEIMEEALGMDVDFRVFHEFCQQNSIPSNVISAGLKPVLRRVLHSFLGEEASSHINIVANDAEILEDGSRWKPIWRYESELGYDKAISMQEGRREAELECEDGTILLVVFIGDGVSDLAAALKADVLFARRGLCLEAYCIENCIDFRKLESMMNEDWEKTGGKGVLVVFNPRANLWRRVSSQRAVPQYMIMSPSREEKMFLWPEAFSELTTAAIQT
ncbi:putative 2,3-diketo-5-methylthio-1-phosphopentane phosphatase [Podospora didyma]|uniref:2,3-diketo-5-methylthio-1-phosphopentane phosphatase n=1 Tax=Podospora didyma TaxID=330526 RepID=A0AAE0KKF3_9PEZI|nr:putative 2,3-diketo-5-methylthio-1-phosphopentane phosphatase [Podospora didyma]